MLHTSRELNWEVWVCDVVGCELCGTCAWNNSAPVMACTGAQTTPPPAFADIPIYIHPKPTFVYGKDHISSCPANVDTLRQTFIVARHGARMPLHAMPLELSWPLSDDFWGDFMGELTPIGAAQVSELGLALRARYVESGFISDADAASTVGVVATHTQRAVQSAMAFMAGCLPLTRYCVVAENDDNERKVHQIASGALPILIDYCGKSTLMKQSKVSHGYSSWKEQAFDSEEFREWMADPVRNALLDKLWDMTHFHKVDPVKPEKRMKGMQTLQTQCSLENVNGMGVLPSASGLELSEEEQAMVLEMSCHIWYCKFQGATPELQHAGGRLGAGYLGHEIARQMSDCVRGAEAVRKLTYYSAHDGTMLALLAHLGVRNFPIPSFAGAIILELHELPSGEFVVETRYTHEPFVYGIDVSQSFTLPLSGITEYRDLAVGATAFEDFASYLTIPMAAAAQTAFAELLESVRDTSALAKGRRAWLRYLHKRAHEITLSQMPGYKWVAADEGKDKKKAKKKKTNDE